MKVSPPPGTTTLVDVLNGGPSATVAADGTLNIKLPKLSAVLLVPQDQANGN
jgi:hypothetical protein